MPKNPARLYSAELEGIEAKIIEVEADINVGLHDFSIVGLGDRSLTEAKERVNSALKNCGVKPPNRENRRITINLAPADIKKTGSQYDLAIALGYLTATGQIKISNPEKVLFLGELALDGRLRPIVGALNIAQKAGELGFTYIFLPKANANEAVLIKNIKIIAVESLQEVINIFVGQRAFLPYIANDNALNKIAGTDFSEIKGQDNAKRALMIAAGGGHNVLLTGPPGVGKSFLARAFAGILPKLTPEEGIEVTKIWSAAGLHPNGLMSDRPFRAPHHTISTMALIGGGADPKPGEISLAHRGVLFLDELPEFQKGTIEALRQPIESGFVNIARTRDRVTFPSRFIFIAAMNPCPCGYYGDAERECTCTAYEVIKYQKKISGPLLDRIDLYVRIGRVTIQELRKDIQKDSEAAETTLVNEKLRAEIEKVRGGQQRRFGAAKTNAEMTSREVHATIRMTSGAEKFVDTFDNARISPRSYYRLLKVAQTIADLEGSDVTKEEHLAEAFSYRIRESQ